MMSAAILLDPEVEPRRRDPRRDCEASIALREMGTFPTHARLINISARGFMAEVASHFAPGARVWLLLPGRRRASAHIVWANGDRIGGQFAEAIDPLEIIQSAGERAL